MRRALQIGVLVLVATGTATALGLDRVKTRQGAQQSGNIVASKATGVTIEIGATRRDIPINEIDLVQFDEEPNELTQARFAVKAGRNSDALALLGKIAPAKMKRPLVAKDVDFYKALAAGQAALAGQGSIADAGKQMFAFEKANRDSFHYYQACETLGDLLLALGNYAVAETYYNKLAEAPSPDYKLRAGVLLGRALVGQKKYDEAIAKFDTVLAADASDADARSQQTAAQLGKAAALSGQGKLDEATPIVEEVIQKADPKDEQLYARAYNIMGKCYREANKPKEAILAFLHVDLLYPVVGDQHAEALANLADLFAADNKPQRAAAARATLREKYPDSAWAKK